MNQWQQRLNGFFTREELLSLKEKCVFVPGCGAIGSYALNILARTGVGKLILADFDSYGVENLPGQLFCNSQTLNKSKAESAKEYVQSVNPEIDVELYNKDWMEEHQRASILKRSDLIIFGFDTLAPGILLYREARKLYIPIIDFYYGTSISAFITFPGDPTPEERFFYPTKSLSWNQTESMDIAKESLFKLTSFVLMNCPWILEEISEDMITNFLNLGKIPVLPSLVAMAGSLMADQAINVLLGKKVIDYKGLFFDWSSIHAFRPIDPADNIDLFHTVYDQLMKKTQTLHTAHS